ncbi:hypothetical protein [Halorarum salinum]|uniref:Uncharacterized protein n=1 Tax=Halorarum salinum TaxID=2743089 RepID=A0A7D5LBY8_9EURY|nr:hypothetical protein [Halobaculum salinum]QLG62847.1 hypothetical protein HUG12_14365 [Halobaculum salinum]
MSDVDNAGGLQLMNDVLAVVNQLLWMGVALLLLNALLFGGGVPVQ